ncbi:MAG: hypothetical protein ACOVO0_00245, partial [Burkholderiaceae bacterium]
FDAQSERAHMHVGQKIMRERASRIGAEVTIDSTPGVGTRVTLTLAETTTTHEPVALLGIRH